MNKAYKPWLSFAIVGILFGVGAGSLMSGTQTSISLPTEEQQIERFSDACARSHTTGYQPKTCENVTH